MVLVQMAFSSHKSWPLAHSSCSEGETDREELHIENRVCVCFWLCSVWKMEGSFLFEPRGHPITTLWEDSQPAAWLRMRSHSWVFLLSTATSLSNHVFKHQLCLACSKWTWSGFSKVTSNKHKSSLSFQARFYLKTTAHGGEATADTWQVYWLITEHQN